MYVCAFICAGLGVGIACVVPPVLLSEIATAETRGTVTTLHQVRVSQFYIQYIHVVKHTHHIYYYIG